ncbi:helix-turn-helix transcriptional regulator, partial [Salmonella enterica]
MSDLDIKQIRADRGLTQRELADLAGVNLSTVWRWE